MTLKVHADLVVIHQEDLDDEVLKDTTEEMNIETEVLNAEAHTVDQGHLINSVS